MNKVLKYSLIGIAVAALGYGVYYFVGKSSKNEDSVKKNRKIKINRK
jgi:hypothetical protein